MKPGPVIYRVDFWGGMARCCAVLVRHRGDRALVRLVQARSRLPVGERPVVERWVRCAALRPVLPEDLVVWPPELAEPEAE